MGRIREGIVKIVLVASGSSGTFLKRSREAIRSLDGRQVDRGKH